MRNYSSTGAAGLIIKGIIALVLIIILAQVFKAVMAIVAALLTLAVVGLGLYFLMNILGNRRRY